jgi:DNA-binding CsgD family transcriptional regulator
VPLEALGPGYVGWSELRQLLRLAGELRELPQGSAQQRRHALAGLAQVVGAQVGLCVDCTMPRAGGPLRLVSAVDVGWCGEKEQAVFATYLREGQPRSLDPTLPRMARDLARVKRMTRTRDQLVGDREWYRSEHVNELRRVARVDSFIYTGELVSPGGDSLAVTLHRPWGARPFSERERRIVEVFHEEAGAFLRPPPPVASDLAPRLRATLDALAAGLSEKQAAARLGISAHTVHEYTKDLYRRFGVSSRAELLARHLGRS